MTKIVKGTSGRILGADEIKLWHRIAKTAKPLPGVKLPELPKTPTVVIEAATKPIISPQPKHRVIKKTEPNIRHLEAASNHKRVRRGKLQIDDTLDLHGLTQVAAQARLESFIIKSVRDNMRCVLVITGKGDSANLPHDIMRAPKGILRERLRDWLNAPNLKPMIAGISQANLRHGGSGAFYVLLKRRQEKV